MITTVVVDFKISASSWEDPVLGGWSKLQDLCKCAPVTRAAEWEDPDEYEPTEKDQKNADEERRRGKSNPKPDSGG